MSNPLSDGAGYIIHNSRIGSTRSRAIIAKADGGSITANRITNSLMHGIHLGPEYYWHESDYVWNVAIRGNHFANVGGYSVFFSSQGALGFRNISILNNIFQSTSTAGTLSVADVIGVNMQNNIFNFNPTTTQLQYYYQSPAVIEQVTVKNNSITNDFHSFTNIDGSWLRSVSCVNGGLVPNNPLLNGDFEFPSVTQSQYIQPTSWTCNNVYACVLVKVGDTSWGPTVASGKQYLALQGAGHSISQPLVVANGVNVVTTLTIAFSARARVGKFLPNQLSLSIGFDVVWGPALLSQTWTTYSVVYTHKSSGITNDFLLLTFSNNATTPGDRTNEIDNILISSTCK